jgi:hypothetical protein
MRFCLKRLDQRSRVRPEHRHQCGDFPRRLDFGFHLRSRAREYHAIEDYHPEERQQQQGANDLVAGETHSSITKEM